MADPIQEAREIVEGLIDDPDSARNLQRARAWLESTAVRWPVSVGVTGGSGGIAVPVRRNCWSCRWANVDTTECFEKWDTVRGWVMGDSHTRDENERLVCRPDADGCPGWEAKETT